jgi:hypothetical protein
MSRKEFDQRGIQLFWTGPQVIFKGGRATKVVCGFVGTQYVGDDVFWYGTCTVSGKDIDFISLKKARRLILKRIKDEKKRGIMFFTGEDTYGDRITLAEALDDEISNNVSGGLTNSVWNDIMYHSDVDERFSGVLLVECELDTAQTLRFVRALKAEYNIDVLDIPCYCFGDPSKNLYSILVDSVKSIVRKTVAGG